MILAFLFDLLLLLFVLAWLAGISFFLVKIVKKSRLKKGIALGLAILAIAFFLFHLCYPWVNNVFVKPFFIWKVEYILIASGGIILVTIRYMNCQTKIHKALILVLGGILLILATVPLSLRPFMHILWNNRQTKTQDGIVLQQSPYSCGAGALTTVLRMKGYPDITEADAVIALRIVPVLGTEPDCVPPAVENLTQGEFYGVVKYCPLNKLDAIELPYISPLKHRGLMGHYVAILEVRGNEVIIGDPLSGKKTISKSDLAKKWKNTVIELKSMQ